MASAKTRGTVSVRPRVIAIAGSLRRDSFNRRLIDSARELAVGLDISSFDLASVPLFNEELEVEGGPEPVQRLWAAAAAADGVLIATPEYNQSIPAVTKNAVDWLSRAEASTLEGKAIAIMGATVGAWGTRHAQGMLRHALAACGAYVMPAPQLYVRAASELFDERGRLSDQGTSASLDSFLQAFRRWIEWVNEDHAPRH